MYALAHVALAATLFARFARTGQLSDINKAIGAQDKAVAATKDYHQIDWVKRMHLGALLLLRRYERTGAHTDLDSAIDIMQKVVRRLDFQEGHRSTSGFYNTLGDALCERGIWFTGVTDLKDALVAHGKALEMTPRHCGHALRHRLSRIALVYHQLEKKSFQTSHEKEQEINWQRLASKLPTRTITGRRDGAMFCLWADYNKYRWHNLEQVATESLAQEAHVPKGHADYPYHVLEHCNILWRQTGSIRVETNAQLEEFISKIISPLEETMCLWPEDHPMRADTFYTLGCMHASLPGSDMKEKRVVYLRQAAMNTHGLARRQLDAVVDWWSTLLGKGRWCRADFVSALDHQMTLMLREENRFDDFIRRWTAGTAVRATWGAIECGRVDKALEFLEVTRYVDWGHLNQLRALLPPLKNFDAPLATEIEAVSRRLDTLPTSGDSWHKDTKRYILTMTRGHLLAQATRQVPGIDRILLPRTFEELTSHLPQSGFVVTISVAQKGCHAIVLSSNLPSPLCIPLPLFSQDSAGRWVELLKPRTLNVAVRGGPGNTMDGPVFDVLEHLWEVVVHPILSGLDLLNTKWERGVILPRIWWCPTGSSSYLPLHAAGIYRGERRVSVHDYVVSSYTPTVTALNEAQKTLARRQQGGYLGSAGLVLVSQPNVPGFPGLPGATTEVNQIKELCKKVLPGLTVIDPLDQHIRHAQRLLAAMRQYGCVHLACHAIQDTIRPLASRFVLKDGPLNLNEVAWSGLGDTADFAFLSRCPRPSAGNGLQLGESFHLAAGMLAAGYLRVVTTMWAPSEVHAPTLVTLFYKHLIQASALGGGRIDGGRSAYALHSAITEFRRLNSATMRDTEEGLLAWMPFVHCGL